VASAKGRRAGADSGSRCIRQTGSTTVPRRFARSDTTAKTSTGAGTFLKRRAPRPRSAMPSRSRQASATAAVHKISSAAARAANRAVRFRAGPK